jgi:hypothetical protein
LGTRGKKNQQNDVQKWRYQTEAIMFKFYVKATTRDFKKTYVSGKYHHKHKTFS